MSCPGTDYDLLTPQLSGGKDSGVMLWSFMQDTVAAGVTDRVITYHAILGPLEWPAVHVDGTRYASMSELAAAQSAACGIPPQIRGDHAIGGRAHHLEEALASPAGATARTPR